MSTINDNLLDTRVTTSRDERLSISIGGISLAIMSQDTTFLDLLRTRYQWFELSDSAGYEIVVRVVPLEELALENGEQPIYPTIGRVNRGSNYIIRRAHNPFLAVVDTSSKKVLVKMWNNLYCFDSFLRALFTLILTDMGGFLLHASAVSVREKGKVFFGPSGSGKTTLARLSTGRTILTDELALIKPHNGTYRVYGTPFWGEFTPGRSNCRAELSGLYSLKKAKKNYLAPMDKVQAVSEIYRCVLFFSDDIRLLSRILDTCSNLVEAVPVQTLHFRPEPSFWQVVDE